MDGFNVEAASRLTACTRHQLRYWDQIGLLRPGIQGTGGRPGVRRLYSFRDLVALRVVKSLLDQGMSLQKLRRGFKELREKGNLDQHLAEVRLVSDGRSIYRIGSQAELVDLLRQGQMAFFVAIDEISRSLDRGVAEFHRERRDFIHQLTAAAADAAAR
ncbi:MAG: MerR family transcriptional regulator [Actinomycetota bacterium]